jgi:hypothetical protein
MKPNGGPAYPSEQTETQGGKWNPTHRSGMTLRDWFAGQALNQATSKYPDLDDAVASAYKVADAMIEERGEP